MASLESNPESISNRVLDHVYQNLVFSKESSRGQPQPIPSESQYLANCTSLQRALIQCIFIFPNNQFSHTFNFYHTECGPSSRIQSIPVPHPFNQVPTMAAFATPFTGASLRRTNPNKSTSPRCAMGDSMAPAIKLKDTKFDGTSSVTVEWEKISPNVSTAQSVEANTALFISLRSRKKAPAALPAKESPPEGVSPADFYFPSDSRNKAPVISFEYDQSVSVSYDIINPQVGGVSANSVESVAFWKETPYKWTAPDTPASSTPETLSTAKFEKYYPTKVRNRAPMIRMKKPAGDWDTSAFLEVGSEYVDVNVDAAGQLAIGRTAEDASTAGAATVSKYFDAGRLHKAPQITIEEDTKVEVSLVDIPEPSSLARIILSGEGGVGQ